MKEIINRKFRMVVPTGHGVRERGVRLLACLPFFFFFQKGFFYFSIPHPPFFYHR